MYSCYFVPYLLCCTYYLLYIEYPHCTHSLLTILLVRVVLTILSTLCLFCFHRTCSAVLTGTRSDDCLVFIFISLCMSLLSLCLPMHLLYFHCAFSSVLTGTRSDDWEYPGWGSVYEKIIDSKKLPPMSHRHQLVRRYLFILLKTHTFFRSF